MRYVAGIFLFALMPVVASASSYLTAQSFPKTFSDLSFVDRMAVLKEGYEPFETKYDENGVCVSGCAFQGMKLEDAAEYYARQADIAEKKADILRAQHPEWRNTVPAVTTPVQNVQTVQTTQPQVYTPPVAAVQPTSSGTCPVASPYNSSIPATQTVPTYYPLQGPVYITSAYGRRPAPSTSGGRTGTSCHRGVDLRAPTGTPVYATIAGTVVTAGYAGDCGNMVKIKGVDGFSVGYCHLSQISVKKGDTVQGGCLVGLAGSTGNSGAPHLHFIVYDNDNAQICPEKFIPTNQNTSGKPACMPAC